MVFERFDPDAKQVMGLAQRRARQHQQGAIAPVHLVLGALEHADPGVAGLLATVGTTPAAALAGIGAIAVVGDVVPEAHIPLGPGAKVAIRAAVALADGRSHRQITPVHLLGGCLDPTQPILVEALRSLGITDAAVAAALDSPPGGRIAFHGIEPA